MLLNTTQTAFSSGEIDPSLRGQTDLKAYRQGAKRVRQCQRVATGGLERRPGTFDLGPLFEARLGEFEFSDTQRYLLAFGAAKVAIYDLNGVLLQTLAGPWTAAQAFELNYSQSADVMVIVHQAFPPKLLRRTSAVTFTLTDLAFDVSIDGGRIYQPHYKFVAPEVTLTPSAATGAITLTASADLFTAANVNQRWRIYDREVRITAITSPTVAQATVQGKLEGKLDLDPLKSKAGTTTIEVLHLFHGLETGASITLSGCNSVGSIPGNQIDGTHVVTVLDELRYEITLTGVSFDYDHDGDSATAPQTRTSAVISEDGGGANVRFAVGGTRTRAWTEPAISAIRGYPGGCCFHDGRLWLFATPSQPDACFGSKALYPFNFDMGKGYDGDSVQVTSGTEDVSRIWHGVANGELCIFTATGESVFIVRDGEPITPNNARVKGQDNAGCAPVQPVVFDGAVLFIHENRLAVSEFLYAPSEARFRSTPVSTLAGHLIRKPVSLATSPGTTTRAETSAFVVNGDGTCAVFHSMRSENIAGWGLWHLENGKFISAAAVGPWVFFAAYVRGEHRLYRLSDDPFACLDGQARFTAGAPLDSWALPDLYRGRPVAVRTDAGYLGVLDVGADGVLDLPVACSDLVVGDPFYLEIELLPPVVDLPQGGQSGVVKRIVSTIVEIQDTYSLTVGGFNVELSAAGDDFDAAVSPLSGAFEKGQLGFGRNPTTTISQRDPLPARVLSALQKVSI